MIQENGKIELIQTLYNDYNEIIGYQVIIIFEQITNLKLGNCKITQNGTTNTK